MLNLNFSTIFFFVGSISDKDPPYFLLRILHKFGSMEKRNVKASSLPYLAMSNSKDSPKSGLERMDLYFLIVG